MFDSFFGREAHQFVGGSGVGGGGRGEERYDAAVESTCAESVQAVQLEELVGICFGACECGGVEVAEVGMQVLIDEAQSTV
jgi:hypothetical protein